MHISAAPSSVKTLWVFILTNRNTVKYSCKLAIYMSFFILHTLFSIICSLSSQASYFLKGRERGERIWTLKQATKNLPCQTPFCCCQHQKQIRLLIYFQKGSRTKKWLNEHPNFFSCEKKFSISGLGPDHLLSLLIKIIEKT